MLESKKVIGCEIIKEYYDIAVERTVQAANGELKTRPMNKPIYNPELPYKDVPQISDAQQKLFEENELYNVVRQGRGVPAAPLIIIGIEP